MCGRHKELLALGEDPLIELDVVEHRAKTPVLDEWIARHLAVVHHTCNNKKQTQI